jgi:secondary thiamine-phosphate synthase enzyme
MKIVRETLQLRSNGRRPEFFMITNQVKGILAKSGVKEGFCLVCTHHTTCSVVTQECSFDETYTGLEFMQQDLLDVFESIIPVCRKEGQYMHPGPKAAEFGANHNETKPESLNTDAHLRSMFMGRNESIVIADGSLDLGEFGHIYFIDFDQTRARDRQVQVQIIGE